MSVPTSSSASSGPEHSGIRGRVLLVDDEAMVVRVIARLLERSGFNVTVHTDPRAALERVRAEPDAFDVLLTDMTMPEMSGIELARGVGEAGAGMPVILLSGWIDAAAERAARAVGIDRILTKPIHVDELIEVMATITSETRH